MVKFKVIGLNFKDGNLVERMNSEGLPSTLLQHNSHGIVIWHECSDELLRAMAASGLEYELSPDTTDPFEGVAKVHIPGGIGLTSYKLPGRTHKTIRRPYKK
jgi:hypothetical protein